MIEMKPIQTIPLKKIDLFDETFSVNFRPDLQNLRSSIREVGLIQPVLLREKGEGYQIISGFRRISVLNELGVFEVSSRLFEKNKKDESQLFSLCLHENVTTRGLNSVEKAIALQKLIDLFKVEPSVVIQTYLPLFHLEPNEKILNTYLSLAQMEDEVKEFVIKEEVSRSNIRKLSALSQEDRKVLIPFLLSLRLGENRLREILILLDEVSRRNRKKIAEIIDRSEIQTILSREELTPSQKTEQVKRFLLELRYPRMTELERDFERRRKDLKLPSNISLSHSPYFEGRQWRIEFRFEKIDDYRSIISFLSQLKERKEFEELLTPPQ